MNRPKLGTLLVAAILCLVLFACRQQPQPTVNGQPAGKPQQWEYKFLRLSIPDFSNIPNDEVQAKTDLALEEHFNKPGADGWEYCGSMDVPGIRGRSIFKRPKR